MPCSKTHFFIGCAAGALVGLASEQASQDIRPDAEINVERILACTAIGGLVGLIPDILEPATSSWHRKLAHSVVVGAAISTGLRRLDGEDSTALTNATIFGYLSHLFADAMTPRSLPLI